MWWTKQKKKMKPSSNEAHRSKWFREWFWKIDACATIRYRVFGDKIWILSSSHRIIQYPDVCEYFYLWNGWWICMEKEHISSIRAHVKCYNRIVKIDLIPFNILRLMQWTLQNMQLAETMRRTFVHFVFISILMIRSMHCASIEYDLCAGIQSKKEKKKKK